MRVDVWDSGMGRDDPLGTASISLDYCIENAITVRGGRIKGGRQGAAAVRGAGCKREGGAGGCRGRSRK